VAELIFIRLDVEQHTFWPVMIDDFTDTTNSLTEHPSIDVSLAILTFASILA